MRVCASGSRGSQPGWSRPSSPPPTYLVTERSPLRPFVDHVRLGHAPTRPADQISRRVVLHEVRLAAVVAGLLELHPQSNVALLRVRHFFSPRAPWCPPSLGPASTLRKLRLVQRSGGIDTDSVRGRVSLIFGEKRNDASGGCCAPGGAGHGDRGA